MSLPDLGPDPGPDHGRRALLVMFALTGCGFTPAYAPEGPGTRLTGQVTLRAPREPGEAALADALRARLGSEGSAYALDYTLSFGAPPQITAADGRVLRTGLVGTVDYRLTQGDRSIASGRVSAASSFASDGTPVATLASDVSARERVAAMLADQIMARLLAALA